MKTLQCTRCLPRYFFTSAQNSSLCLQCSFISCCSPHTKSANGRGRGIFVIQHFVKRQSHEEEKSKRTGEIHLDNEHDDRMANKIKPYEDFFTRAYFPFAYNICMCWNSNCILNTYIMMLATKFECEAKEYSVAKKYGDSRRKRIFKNFERICGFPKPSSPRVQTFHSTASTVV
jgi:hypothetical protein